MCSESHQVPDQFKVEDQPPGLERIIDRLDTVRDRGSACIRDIVRAFGTATFVPFLIVPAILVVSPLSGIPLFSSICGIAIALISAQMLLRREHLWLPNWFLNLQFTEDQLEKALGPAHRIARFIDRISKPKWRILNRPPFDLIPEALCMLAGLSMPFLEVVPFSSSALALAVLCFSVGFLARDGRFTLVAIGIMALAMLIPINLFLLVST